VAELRGVLVVDFGAQYAQLIARRVREAHVYSEIVPSSITAAEVKAKNPAAVILSGGPSSVYADNAPKIDAGIFALGIPVFGICYGFQAMAALLAKLVSQSLVVQIQPLLRLPSCLQVCQHSKKYGCLTVMRFHKHRQAFPFVAQRQIHLLLLLKMKLANLLAFNSIPRFYTVSMAKQSLVIGW
jgi:anthranilate/para-aminobenzoate synthase component II